MAPFLIDEAAMIGEHCYQLWLRPISHPKPTSYSASRSRLLLVGRRNQKNSC
ncbi:hypothetical protein [Arthrobacter sp. RIT-PI-e]|uniref:hypothetical protein n=1 Tax=Arthrobacter sp. RIT-PI-e TaxID=1681197 RepID=UPI00136490D6|nr:hypothetical protein [Arthrobacter sp. RIT-PI-e]